MRKYLLDQLAQLVQILFWKNLMVSAECEQFHTVPFKQLELGSYLGTGLCQCDWVFSVICFQQIYIVAVSFLQ